MTTKRNKKASAEEQEETTGSIEQAGQDQGIASIAMVDNARAKLSALEARTRELQTLTDKKTSQIDDIENTIATCEQHYEEAERVHNELGQRVTRETVKLDVAKGTMAEEERAEIFASVVRVFEKSQTALAQAAHDRASSRERQGLAQSIREEIQEHRREMSDLVLVRREYDAVLEEVHAQKGRELAQAITDGIIAARDNFEQTEQAHKDSRVDYVAATQRIDTLRSEYPELAKELWASHGHFLRKPDEKAAGEYCLEGLRDYILTILTHGPKAKHTEIYEGRKQLIEYLAIPLGDIQELLNNGTRTRRSTDAWGRETVDGTPWHPALDRIDALIKEVRISDYKRY